MGSFEGGTSGRNQTGFRAVDGLSVGTIDAASVVDEHNTTVIAVQSEPGYWLAITFSDGCEITADFGDVIRRGGAFKPLQDERLFALVRISHRGDRIEWPVPRGGRGGPLISIDAASIYRAFDHIIAGGDGTRMA
jgi:Protein of unknown function (DUF2442)